MNREPERSVQSWEKGAFLRSLGKGARRVTPDVHLVLWISLREVTFVAKPLDHQSAHLGPVGIGEEVIFIGKVV